MKRLYMLAAAVPLLAMAAAAQEAPRKEALRQEIDDTLQRVPELQRKMKAEFEAVAGQMKVIGLSGAAMGPTVKGAPYSAVEVSENNQVLADGTRIHNENRTTVYRDSEGRVRRETPTQTTIMDPVAGVSYFLNPKTLTATKGTLSMPMIYKRTGPAGEMVTAGGTLGAFVKDVGVGPGTENSTFEVRTSKEGTVSVTVNGRPEDPANVVKWERSMTVNGAPVDEQTFAIAQDKMKAEMIAAGAGGVLRRRVTSPGKTEALGKQMIEGVNCDGTRLSTTLDTGAVGNDRPIQMVNERWYSSELQTVMMTKHSDPRTGEEIFRLVNVSRSEPGADLFQVPASYQILDRK